MSDLDAALRKEFARLGVDPSKVASAAPAGTENAVFDLSATLTVAGVELQWTERLCGDYDQNGEVNISDLGPVGGNWNESIEYDDAASHNGFAAWPIGDPEAGGSTNWRLARIDGDNNGLITIAELTPLAVHLKQRLDGYRVYRKGPADSQFNRVGDLLTVPRPVAEAGKPVRYSYTDEPPNLGDYEYFVVPYASNEGQGDLASQSDVVVATVGAGFADTTPPVWGSTVGITSAVANSDGSVTVEFGTATDVATPPAPASPPVSYTVYYSTETPLDFDRAARIEGVSSPWTSPPLLNGVSYYFAARVKDNATAPNQDSNVIEREVIPEGSSTVDIEGPEWAEVGYSGDDYGFKIPGIKEVIVGNGSLFIRRASAIDSLSPPVRYSLHYLSDRASEPFVIKVNGRNAPNPIAQVVEDLPEEYELTWPNRHRVRLLVTATDSALPPNTSIVTTYDLVKQAPSDLTAVDVNTELPGIGRLPSVFSAAFDPVHKLLYQTYADGASPHNLHCVVWDCRTGTWTHEDVGQAPSGGSGSFTVMRMSVQGKVWSKLVLSFGPFDVRNYYWWRSANGQWAEWNPEGKPSDWDGWFDHNGFPSQSIMRESSTPDRFQSFYRFFDPVSQTFKEEGPLADPGGTFESHPRPDGSLALIMQKDHYGIDGNPDLPVRNGWRVFNRTAAGAWSAVPLDVPREADLFGTDDDWDAKWRWSYGYEVGDQVFALAEDEAGIGIHGPYPRHPLVSPYYIYEMPESDGLAFLANSLWDGSQYLDFDYNVNGGYSMLHPLIEETQEFYFGRSDGFCFSLQDQPAADGSGWKVRAFIMPPGKSIFELSP